MQYNDIEMKLIRLALDKAAHDGEFANAATMLIKQLRKRGVTPEQLAGGSNSSHYETLYRQAEFNVSYYRTKALNLENENTRLKGELSRARQASGTAGESTQSSYYSNATGTPPRQRRPRTKYGMRVLSEIERALLFKIAKRASSTFVDQDLGRPMRACCDTHQEFGTIQQLMRKGMVEKAHRRGWHKLTEKGIAFWKQYGSASV